MPREFLGENLHVESCAARQAENDDDDDDEKHGNIIQLRWEKC